MTTPGDLQKRAEAALRKLYEEGVVTAVTARYENRQPKIDVWANVQTDVRAPDFDATRFEAVNARIRLALGDMPIGAIHAAAKSLNEK